MFSGRLGERQPLAIEGTDAKGLSAPRQEKQEHGWVVHGCVGVAGTLWRNPGRPRARFQLGSVLLLKGHGSVGPSQHRPPRTASIADRLPFSPWTPPNTSMQGSTSLFFFFKRF